VPTYAFVFPGQGSQYVGMARELVSASPAAAAIFAEAEDALGESIGRVAWQGPEQTLNLTENAQPALVAASVAYLAAIRERWARLGIDPGEPAFIGGHSMGQYSALVAAGSLSLSSAVLLVRERGRLMQASGEGSTGRMAAVIGLDDAALPTLVERAGAAGIIGVANRNAPGQVVLSGDKAAIDAAADIARELGARRYVELPVSVAAHSPLMRAAAEGMRRALSSVDVADPHPAILANEDARSITTADGARTELVEHLTHGVDWVRTIETMVAAGVSTFIEVGPGRVLTGLDKRIAPDADAIATDDASAPDRLVVPFAPAGDA
jgi:[acyl-carrier-protein] S-malonyltransferase